jgi:tetratricopeptide (TPR) repeat protein
MNGRLRLGLMALVSLSLAAIPLQPQAVSAQEASARFRVMVSEIQPMNGADKKFGQRLADQLRELINDMDTHQPIEEKELKNALKQYDVDMEDLDCTKARQLAGLINAQVVFCGSYTPEGEGWNVVTKFIGSDGEEFPVDAISVGEKGQQEAAEHIYNALQIQSDQARASQFCGDYAASSQWDDALNMCSQAIDLNPLAVAPRFTRGQVYRQLDQNEQALTEFLGVLELDPLHEDAMQLAGYLSAVMGRDNDARDYYRQYLTLNPSNANVRMRVAYDLAQAGDPLGAMQFIEEGLAVDGENVDLLKQHGGFAFTAALEGNQGQEEMPPEVADLFRKALVSYGKAYDAEGAEMDVSLLRNLVVAHINLDELPEAVTLAERVLETHGNEATMWSIYADALQRSGRVDEAIDALDQVLVVDPDYTSPVAVRKGNWLLQEGRIDEAVPELQQAVARGEQTADAVATLIFANGVNEGIQKDDWGHAIRTLRLAKDFDIEDLTEQQFDFYLGYAIFQSAQAQAKPNTLESAKVALPRFLEVRRLMQGCADYAQRDNREGNRQEFLTATATFIEIQEAIIARGR